MKVAKLFFTYRLALIMISMGCSFVAMAQKSVATGSFFSLQVKGGVNLAQIKTDAGSFNANLEESLQTQKGYVFGASMRVGRKLFIQPELLFSQKGGEVKSLVNNVMTGFDMQYTTLDLPLLVGYKIGRFHILGGPVFSNNISSNTGLKEAINATYYSYLNDNGYKKSTMAFQVGAGLTLLGLTLDVRYETGQNILNSIQNLEGLTTKPQLIQATIGFKII